MPRTRTLCPCCLRAPSRGSRTRRGARCVANWLRYNNGGGRYAVTYCLACDRHYPLPVRRRGSRRSTAPLKAVA